MLSPREIEDLTLELVGIQSVNGTPGEAAAVEFLAARLRESPLARRGDLKVYLLSSPQDPLHRPVVVAHRPGRGRSGVLLMGHIDTVGVDDYLDLEDDALRPHNLTERIAQGALGAEMAALARSGDWLFGRGVLDMKSGVAAALAAFLSLAESAPDGHLLFAATPDEEGSSHGVRVLDAWLAEYLPAAGFTLGAVLNTDYTTSRPDDAGSFHAYAGSTGKLLPAVYVQGIPSHAAEPERGLDPSAALAAITSEVAYSEVLRDAAEGDLAPPPVTLFQRDGKPFYDVQTALYASAYYNLFHRQRTPGEQLERFVQQARRGAQAFAERTVALSLPPLRVISFADLAQAAPQVIPPAVDGLDVREAARRIVASLVAQTFPDEPVAVCYFAGPLIPSVESAPWARLALESAVAAAGVPYRVHRYYPYISDLSFLAESRDWDDAAFVENYPLAAFGGAAGIPPRSQLAPLMLGPHGFGAHQRSERVLRPHAFEILPRLLHSTAEELLRAQPVG
ncbi:MAG: M20/M25/M40 family metallo-hydrolase [Thermaerobacter sp.]|nr:M20/M25/M40 family metallo-hydrolase [Thermaerobacter sp.]